jgi:hypothetical protein
MLALVALTKYLFLLSEKGFITVNAAKFAELTTDLGQLVL